MTVCIVSSTQKCVYNSLGVGTVQKKVTGSRTDGTAYFTPTNISNPRPHSLSKNSSRPRTWLCGAVLKNIGCRNIGFTARHEALRP